MVIKKLIKKFGIFLLFYTSLYALVVFFSRLPIQHHSSIRSDVWGFILFAYIFSVLFVVLPLAVLASTKDLRVKLPIIGFLFLITLFASFNGILGSGIVHDWLADDIAHYFYSSEADYFNQCPQPQPIYGSPMTVPDKEGKVQFLPTTGYEFGPGKCQCGPQFSSSDGYSASYATPLHTNKEGFQFCKNIFIQENSFVGYFLLNAQYVVWVVFVLSFNPIFMLGG